MIPLPSLTGGRSREHSRLAKASVENIIQQLRGQEEGRGVITKLQEICSRHTTVRPQDTRPQAVRTLTMHDFEWGPKKFEMHEFM